MIVGGHQAIYKHIYERQHILSKTAEKEKVILRFEEHSLTIISPIVEVVVQIRGKRAFSTRHGCSLEKDFRSPTDFGSLETYCTLFELLPYWAYHPHFTGE
jgi:hypothetical protein